MEDNKLPKDSGSTQEFNTGAHRDNPVGKGRCDLLPLDEIIELCGDDYFLQCIKRFMEDHSSRDAMDAIRYLVAHCGRLFVPRPLDANNMPIEDELSEMAVLYGAVLDVSLLYEAGAIKYGADNWKSGMPIKRYIDSAIRHYLKGMSGWVDEPHFRAVIWNLLGAIWTSTNMPEMWDVPAIEYNNKGE